MPVYEYVCRECGTVSEFIEHIGGGRVSARRCSKCGSVRLRKAASRFAFHREVTLEDLGINVIRQPAGAQTPAPAPTGPPPGGCPFCDTVDGGSDTNGAG